MLKHFLCISNVASLSLSPSHTHTRTHTHTHTLTLLFTSKTDVSFMVNLIIGDHRYEDIKYHFFQTILSLIYKIPEQVYKYRKFII
jgi:hypothetical protein